jgi:glutamyl-tRNA reductase
LQQLNQQSILFAVGVNHKTAPIEVREQIYVHESETPALLAELRKTLSECVVLSTCNRTEIYGVTRRTDLDLDFYKDLLIDFKKAESAISREHFFGLVSCAACQQLFRVATSIDSKIVGDIQILGQLREAYSFAAKQNSTGKILNQLFQRGFKIGKLARAETNLHKGAVSISLAAVELAAETFESLNDKTILIVGAGETARLTAECLIKKRVGKIVITNRTQGNADELLENLCKSNHFAGETVDFSGFKNYLNETDIVISSTSAPEPILEKADFADQTNKILLIDLAVPRDIAPEVAEMENVVLKNIDDLHQIIDKNYQRRMADLPLVKRNIMREMSDFLVWYYSLPLLPTALRGGAKPDEATLKEIVEVKEFLLKNVSHVHKLAMRNGAENFAGHVEVVNELAAMKRAAFAPEEA